MSTQRFVILKKMTDELQKWCELIIRNKSRVAQDYLNGNMILYYWCTALKLCKCQQSKHICIDQSCYLDRFSDKLPVISVLEVCLLKGRYYCGPCATCIILEHRLQYYHLKIVFYKNPLNSRILICQIVRFSDL